MGTPSTLARIDGSGRALDWSGRPRGGSIAVRAARRAGVREVGAQRSAKAAFAGRGQHDPEVRGPNPVIGFGARQRAYETQACRSVPMMMVNVGESAVGRGEAEGAVVLAIKAMAHPGGKDV